MTSVLGLERQYTTMAQNVLAVLIARAGGTVTITRTEFESAQTCGTHLRFDAAADGESMTMYLEKLS